MSTNREGKDGNDLHGQTEERHDGERAPLSLETMTFGTFSCRICIHVTSSSLILPSLIVGSGNEVFYLSKKEEAF